MVADRNSSDGLGYTPTGGSRGFERAEEDLYPTPPALIEPLIARWRCQFGEGIWEPACGDGALCKVRSSCGAHSLITH